MICLAQIGKDAGLWAVPISRASSVLAFCRDTLAIPSVLASLYPVTTVLLAAFVLHERLSRLQLTAVLLTFGAVVLISTG